MGQKYLAGLNYPAAKDKLIEPARQRVASQDVIDAPSAMPDGRYDGPNEVSRAVAKS